jgi:hypothetical protein
VAVGKLLEQGAQSFNLTLRRDVDRLRILPRGDELFAVLQLDRRISSRRLVAFGQQAVKFLVVHPAAIITSCVAMITDAILQEAKLFRRSVQLLRSKL